MSSINSPFSTRAAPLQSIDILCFRHGQTTRNASGLIQGQDNGPDTQLTALGQAQAEKTGQTLKERYPNITRFYTSQLGRCLETTQLIAKYFQNASIIKWDNLKAVNHDMYDGMDYQLRNKLCAHYYKNLLKTQADTPLDPFIKWKHNPLAGAETYYQVWERAIKTLIEISEDFIKKNGTTNITPSINLLNEESRNQTQVQLAVAATTVFIQSLITRSQYEYNGGENEVLPLFFELPQPLPNCIMARFRYHPQESQLEKKIQFIGLENLVPANVL